MYIEDSNLRLTVITSGPLGGSSLREGQLEIMQDRQLLHDDNRGLGQGVVDNVPTKHTFRILLEERQPNCYVSISSIFLSVFTNIINANSNCLLEFLEIIKLKLK